MSKRLSDDEKRVFTDRIAELETCDLCENKAEYRQCQQCMNDKLIGSHTDEDWKRLQEENTLLAEHNQALRESLTEQLCKRGFAYRGGNCDGVPDDIRRAFIAVGLPCDEIDKVALLTEGDKPKSLSEIKNKYFPNRTVDDLRAGGDDGR